MTLVGTLKSIPFDVVQMTSITAGVFRETVKQLFAARPSAATASSSPGVTTVRTLCDHIPSEALICLNALSPKATQSALLSLDQHLGEFPPSPPPCKPHPLLHRIVTVHVFSEYVATSVSLNGNKQGQDTDVRAVVTIRDIVFNAGRREFGVREREDNVQRDLDGLNEVHCTCHYFNHQKRFEEPYCKHVIIALFAIAFSLTHVKVCSTSDEFLALLG